MIKFVLILAACASVAFSASFPKKAFNHDNRIYGGEFAQRNQYPFTAVLLVFEDDDDFLCGGALISNRYTLTTAKCLYQSVFIRLSIGVYNYDDVDDRTDISYNKDDLLAFLKVHEGFNPKTLSNNIALLRTKEDIEFSEKIQPIALPPASSGMTSLLYSIVTIIGWGVSDGNNFEITYPRHAKVQVLPAALCRHYYSSLDKNSVFCSDGEYKKGACTLDEGGPAISSDGMTHRLVGLIALYGQVGCDAGWPTAYVSVAEYANWIGENIRLEMS